MNINMSQKLNGCSNPMRLIASCLLILGLLVSASNNALAQETTNRTTYYHNTMQGTPVAATDEAGEIKWSQTYSSYGFHNGNSQEIEESSLVFGTAGHVEDQFDDRLLVYQKARYYDPALGRFLSIDPVGFQASNPQSFNRYAYVNNNPTTYVDPDGRFPFLIPVVIFLGKEIAAEVASRATNGATDFLSVRRLGTSAVKSAAKGLKSLRKKDVDVPKSAGQLGREGEATAIAITGVGKNTTKFPVNGRNRIPDQVNAVNPTTGNPVHVTEVKNVASQSFTRQLRDNVDLVGPGGRVDVFVRPNTNLSGPLKRANADPTNPINIRPEL